MVLVDYSDSASSSSGDDSDDDDDDSAQDVPDPPCATAGKRSHAHGGRARVSPANRAVLREIATSVVVPRALEQRRLREFCARSRGALQFYTDAPGSTVELNRELAVLHGAEAGQPSDAAGHTPGAMAFRPPPAFAGEGHGTRMRRRERAALLSSLTALEPDEPQLQTALESDVLPPPTALLESDEPPPPTALLESDESPPSTALVSGESPPPTPPSGPAATIKQTPSPPPADGGFGDDDDDDNGTAVRACRSALHRMEAAGCRPCLGQLRRLRRPLVVRRLTVAGAAVADDDDAAHATRGDDEAVEHVIGGGDRTEVVRLWRGRRLVATYVSPRAWQRLGGDRARDGAALLSALDAPLGTIVRTSRTSTFKRGGDRVAAVPGPYCAVGYSGQPWWPLRAYAAATAGQQATRTAAADALITATGRIYDAARPAQAARAAAYEAEAREAGVYEHGPRRGELPAPALAFGDPFVMAAGHADGDSGQGVLVARSARPHASCAARGEHFYFPTLRTLVKFDEGGVLFFNPKVPHCATEGYWEGTPPLVDPPARYLLSCFLKPEMIWAVRRHDAGEGPPCECCRGGGAEGRLGAGSKNTRRRQQRRKRPRED